MLRLKCFILTSICSYEIFTGKSGDDSLARRSGSVPDLTTPKSKENSSAKAVPSSSTYDELYYKHIVQRGRRHGRRMREYDSDTGYRSDREIRFRIDGEESRGANSEILSVRSQPLPNHHHQHHHRNHSGRRRDGAGYASDLEAYGSSSLYPTANAAAAAFQQKHHGSGQSSSPAATPQLSRNFRPHSPSRSEPRNYGGRSGHHGLYRRSSNPKESGQAGSDFSRINNPMALNDTHSSASNEEFYKRLPGKEYYPADNIRGNNERLVGEDYYTATPQQTTSLGSQYPMQISNGPQLQNPMGPGPPSQNPMGPGPPSQSQSGLGPPPAVAPKPNLNSSGGSNLSLHQASPSPPVFHKDNFIDQSTPVVTQAPVQLANGVANQNVRDRRGSNLYTVVEERGGSQKNLVCFVL